jgi:hypothetical protein
MEEEGDNWFFAHTTSPFISEVDKKLLSNKPIHSFLAERLLRYLSKYNIQPIMSGYVALFKIFKKGSTHKKMKTGITDDFFLTVIFQFKTHPIKTQETVSSTFLSLGNIS